MIDMMSFVLVALATTGIAIMARALPWPEWAKARKPLACPACMSGWAGFMALGLVWLAGALCDANIWTLAALWTACIGVSAPIFHHVYPPHIEIDLPSDDAEQ